ncbi:MAG: FtsH protease activity modulator HflK [Proteobacteria bacterium]|nr:FtsH protease activity modulator HflK [Pseudomonadota bacterium]MBU4298035.1 FtsH protease activity modulator HflK [Pseudomonadota bacterium]MCG2749456.1 FtsH protease activity modulator HflK [Desulfobulbaceae bacterium]
MALDDQQPPWGQKKRPSTPEEMIAAVLKKIKESFEGSGGGTGGGRNEKETQPGGPGPNIGGSIMKVVAVIAIIFFIQVIYSSFYTIEPGEKGVVLRLGKFNKFASSGLNFKIPLIDDVIKVDVETVRKLEFGFRTRIPGQKSVFVKQGYDMESLMLTGDKNVIDCEWIVQYKVQDPFLFLFKVGDVDQAVRDVSEMAIRGIVGNRDFDYVLGNREVIEAATARELQTSLNKYMSGVKVLTVKLQDVNPPDPVKPAFNEVNEADQDMKRLVNEAEQTYNKLIPKARGDAKKLLEESHGYAIERTNLAKGETSRFLAVLEEYKKAEEVTRKRMYLETMQQVLPSVTDIYVIDKGQQSILPFLDLSGSRKAVPQNTK